MLNQKNSQATSLQFTFEGNHQIQTILLNDEPYFVAVDVCNTLGIVNTSDNLKKTLDNDEYLPYIVSRSGQNRKINIVSESGLYALIFQSRKPNAKEFRKWVTSEVLPTLRKTGKYETSQPKPLSASSKYNRQRVETYLSLDEVESLREQCKKLGYKSVYELLQQLVQNFLKGKEPLKVSLKELLASNADDQISNVINEQMFTKPTDLLIFNCRTDKGTIKQCYFMYNEFDRWSCETGIDLASLFCKKLRKTIFEVDHEIKQIGMDWRTSHKQFDSSGIHFIPVSRN